MSAIKFSEARKIGYEHNVVQDFASPEDMSRLSSGNILTDIILAEGASVSFAPNREWLYRRNANAIVVGGSGAGKTYSCIKPNLLNHMEANYVVTDTKGALERATAEGFAKDGYQVQALDAVNLDRSCCFNPLAYIGEESEIPSFSKLLFDAVSPGRNAGTTINEDFWNATAEMLLEGLLGMCFACEEVDGRFSAGWQGGREPRYLNMEHVLKLVDLINVPSEWGPSAPSPLDYFAEQLSSGKITFDPIEKADGQKFDPKPYCLGVQQYRLATMSAERTLRSIVITLNATLFRFRTDAVRRVFSRDELDLDAIDEGRRVLYINMSDNDSTNGFIGRIVFKLLLNRSLKKADAQPAGMLARPVMFICDEFANLGEIPDFEKMISVTRSRNMSLLLCVQSTSQLDLVYGHSRAQIILDNCDSLVYMGSGSSIETAGYFAKLCGDSVLGTERVGIEGTKGIVRGEVMTAGDVSRLSRDECVVKVSGMRPFRTRKYDLRSHPNAGRFLKLDE